MFYGSYSYCPSPRGSPLTHAHTENIRRPTRLPGLGSNRVKSCIGWFCKLKTRINMNVDARFGVPKRVNIMSWRVFGTQNASKTGPDRSKTPKKGETPKVWRFESLQDQPTKPNDLSRMPKMGTQRSKTPPRLPKTPRRGLPRESRDAKIVDFL